MTKETIFSLANEFRLAILQADREKLPTSLEEFPKGPSSDAHLLLAKYLEVQGQGEFDLMFGKFERLTHCWLENDELVVDICAGQFGCGFVVVSDNTGWHAERKGQSLGKADYTTLDQPVVEKLDAAFRYICTFI